MINYACIERNPKSLVTQIKLCFLSLKTTPCCKGTANTSRHFRMQNYYKLKKESEKIDKDTTAKNIGGVVTNSINTWWRFMAKIAFLQERNHWLQWSHPEEDSKISHCCEIFKETSKIWSNWGEVRTTKMVNRLRTLVCKMPVVIFYILALTSTHIKKYSLSSHLHHAGNTQEKMQHCVLLKKIQSSSSLLGTFFVSW